MSSPPADETLVQRAVGSVKARFAVMLDSHQSFVRSMRIMRRANQVPVRHPLVLISQIQRSGGTLLSQLFDNHPACFAYPHELSWGRPVRYSWPELTWARADGADLFRSLDDEFIARFARVGYSKQSARSPVPAEVFPFVFDRRLQRDLFSRALRERPTSQRDVLNAFLTAHFNAWVDYQNLYRGPKRFVTAFTPRVHMYPGSAERYFGDYPDGYMISVIRDPESWYASARRHNPREYGEGRQAVSLWTASTEATLRLADAHPSQVVPLLFSTLVRDTAATMRAVCQKIGLPWHETLVTPTFNGMPIAADSSFKISGHGIVKDAADRREGIEAGTADAEEWREAQALYEQAGSACLNV